MLVKNLTKYYKNKLILDNITVAFLDRNISVIVGVNGSGKTTFFECMIGLKAFKSGDISIGVDAAESKAFKEKVFYIPSEFYLPEFMTGEEYVLFIAKRYPNANLKSSKTLFEIFGLVKEKKKLIETYSFGMKKKIQIIGAIIANTNYILADELFSGLDFETTVLTQELLSIISKERAIILISHDKSTLEKFPEQIFLLQEGKLKKFEGNVKEITDIVKEKGGIDGKIRAFETDYFST